MRSLHLCAGALNLLTEVDSWEQGKSTGRERIWIPMPELDQARWKQVRATPCVQPGVLSFSIQWCYWCPFEFFRLRVKNCTQKWPWAIPETRRPIVVNVYEGLPRSSLLLISELNWDRTRYSTNLWYTVRETLKTQFVIIIAFNGRSSFPRYDPVQFSLWRTTNKESNVIDWICYRSR